jgi:hypothetical protein
MAQKEDQGWLDNMIAGIAFGFPNGFLGECILSCGVSVPN